MISHTKPGKVLKSPFGHFDKGLKFLCVLGLLGILTGCADKEQEKKDEPGEVVNWLIVSQYLEQNKLDEAEAALRKIASMNPEDPVSYAELGSIYLKLGKYKEAGDQIAHALKLDAKNLDFRLLLAEIQHRSGNDERAFRELEQIIGTDPDNAKAYYMLATMDMGGEPEAVAHRREYLQKLIELLPANVVPLMDLIQLEAQQDRADDCLGHLERLREIMPELSEDINAYFNQISKFLGRKKMNSASRSIQQLYQFLKVTPLYTQGMQKVQGPQSKVTGYPVFFTDQIRTSIRERGINIMDLMRFTDATEATGLETGGHTNIVDGFISITDYDGDGDIDIYYTHTVPGESTSTHFLFNSELGKFTNAVADAGLDFRGIERAGLFTDYNNDGSMDFFVSMDTGNVFLENLGDGTFENVTEKSGVAKDGKGNSLFSADLDQDGDLDIYMARNGENHFFRNNADGTFLEQARDMALGGGNGETVDVDYADLDNDGDLDVLVLKKDGEIQLFTNNRYANFENIATRSGLKKLLGEAGSIAVSDYNNDGMIDIYAASGRSHVLYRNQGDGTFLPDKDAGAILKEMNGTAVRDATFLDFDNDGHMDLLVVGTTEEINGKGIFLWHNNANGGFENTSYLLPETIKEGFSVEIGDFNNDGDQDIFIAGPNGLHLIRNDTGNLNHNMQVQLVGLSYGNGKNNRLGIGAQIMIKSGDIFQLKTMTGPVAHFGLGNHGSVDVLRVIWPNGVSQNIENPRSKADFVEEQVLKGSCPFLFTWNGKKYEFQKDMMWRSALGMPLAVKGKDTLYAFADISQEYLKIPGEKLKPKNGKYSIKITEELWETVYFDKASLIAVDHPKEVDIFVDERFTLPPFPGKEVYAVHGKNLPILARTGKGKNVLPQLSKYDFDYVSDFELDRYQGLTKMHDLILDLGEKAQTDNLRLYLRGWVFPADASINLAMTQTEKYQLVPPSLQVRNAKGEWKTVISDMGYPMGKDKMVIADLSGKFPTKNREIRIRTNMRVYWDHIFFDTGTYQTPFRMHDLKMVGASLDFRGYSITYRKGGRYGPHWFDHDKVTKGQKWRDLTGNYTRYGDVLPLLWEGDDMYIIANSGDEVTIDFDAENLPELPDGWTRDFLIYSEGWVKDGDLNTRHGQTVEPLPFRNMKEYPYGKDAHYPTDWEHEAYRKKYNTRKVDTYNFKKELLPDAR